MDKPPPDDFDPSQLVDDPMQEPRESDDKHDERHSAQQDDPNRQEELLPMLHLLPPSLRKAVFAGSCCTGVAVLYVLSSWDHGWIPGLESQFAKADSLRAIDAKYETLNGLLSDLYVLTLARAIKDLSEDNCVLQSDAVGEQIDALQLKYKARTGDFYRHTECKKVQG
jgi:hypothetical protein